MVQIKIPGPISFLKYIWALKYYILAAIVIFTAFYVIGYSAAILSPDVGNTVVSSFKQDVSPMKELSPLGLMLGIFANNALKCFLVMILGLAFGILPVLFILSNGLILGVVIGVTITRTGLLYVLVGVIPHGIIELPMVFISTAMGLKLGMDMLMALMRRNVNMFREIKQALLIFLVWVFPLLFLAAFVESFVTGPILYMLFGAH